MTERAPVPTSEVHDDSSVTVVTSRRVKPGHDAAFGRWLEGIGNAAAKYPGFVWRRIVRPGEHGIPEYAIMFKFDSYANLRAWTESAERHLWLERVKPHVVDDFKETVLTGLERWFTLPGHAGVPPPPPHKMALVTLAVVYPLSLTLGVLANRWLAPLAPALRSLVASAMMIVLMTWVIMPRVTRLLRRWLYPPD